MLADGAVIEMVACLDWDSDHVGSSFAYFLVHPTLVDLVDQPSTKVKLVMKVVTSMKEMTMVNSLSEA